MVLLPFKKKLKPYYTENKNMLDSEAKKLNFNSGSDTSASYVI